jgi:hypothetical protein
MYPCKNKIFLGNTAEFISSVCENAAEFNFLGSLRKKKEFTGSG